MYFSRHIYTETTRKNPYLIIKENRWQRAIQRRADDTNKLSLGAYRWLLTPSVSYGSIVRRKEEALIRFCAALLVVYTVLIGYALGQSPTQAAENPVPVVIIEGRTGVEAPSGGSPDQPAADGSRWETSPPVLQAIAAARSYWSAENPDFQEKLRVWGSASGAFTRPDVEQHAVLFMMSNIPHCCPPMGLAIVEGDQLVRNIAVVTIAQSVRTMPDIDGDGRDELIFGGGFMGQGLVTEGVTLATFGEEGLDDFGKATTFESACGAGYGDTGALAARLSVVPGAEIIVQHYRQPSCDLEIWEPVGEPEPLQPISSNEKTVYTEIPLGVTATN